MKKNSSQLKKTALVSALLLEFTTFSQAADITVDGINCTLNDAVVAANTDAVAGGCTAGSGADTIELPANGNLTANSLINSEITINGNGSTVDGSGSDTVFKVAGGLLTLNDVVVTNGTSQFPNYNSGGGVSCQNGGALHLNRSTVTDNYGYGVGLGNCTATIIDSQISNNASIPYDPFSPAPYNNGFGAGLLIFGSTVNIERSTISNNVSRAYYGGGGIAIHGSTVTISNSTISGNKMYNREGGGIYINRTIAGDHVVELSLFQVTVVSNFSDGPGGGMINANNNPSTLVTISQSIIAGNRNQSGLELFNVNGGNIQVDDFNVFGYSSNSGVNGVTLGASDLVPPENLPDIIDTNLSDNGGYTPTHALVSGSPAIDFVPAVNCETLTDQIGTTRPIDGDLDGTSDCDVGAVEMLKPDLIFADGFD